MTDRRSDPTALLDAPSQVPVSQLLREWATRTPDAAAVCQGPLTWSYGELVRAMGAIGGELRSRTRPGQVVAVAGQPTPALIAAMCAVLDQGCVLMPLDRGMPVERLRGMVAEARAELVLDAGDAPDLGITVLPVSPVGAGAESASDPRTPAPEDPAYVFFTSGTTGRPKGILGNHRGLSHFLAWQRDRFELGPGQRCAQLTGLSFDVVMRAIFQPLGSGATLCLPEPAITPASAGVVAWLQRARITMLHVVPSLARHWLETAQSSTLPDLRLTFFAGEVLTDTLVRRWRALCPHTEVINLYGPTETTLAKCYFVVPAEPVAGIQPVGGPLPHSQALVLTADRARAAVGEPGEVYIRTPFRTNGYLNGHPDGARFVRNPFRDDPTDLLYQTGDRGVLASDGTLLVQGRIDDQVKISGVRVEPAEVAATLAAEAGVRGAEVIARGTDERRFLVAYVVIDEERERDATTLRVALARKLPAPMIPAVFVFLDEFPLNANGKVDRGALPTPLDPTEDETAYVAPSDPLEVTLAGIWANVLGKERVGVHDNFFALGGDSLRSVRVMHELSAAIGFEPSPRLLFDAPTIAELAAVVRRSERRDVVPIERTGRSVGVATPGQRACWNVQRGDPKNPFTFIRLALGLDGPVDAHAMERSLAVIVRRHGVLRTVYEERDGALFQRMLGVDEAPSIALERVALSGRDELKPQQAALVARIIDRIDLARGVCLGAGLIELEPGRHVLLLVIHHISFDAGSERALLEELAAAYASLSEGGSEAALTSSEPPLQYLDYAADLARHAESSAGRMQRAYWVARLADAPAVELPVDLPREALDARRDAAPGGFVCLPMLTSVAAISAEDRGRLHELAGLERATVYMVMLAACAGFLHRLTGQGDICIQSIFGQRHHPMTERMPGFFANPLVMRIDASGAWDARRLIARVQEVVLTGYEHGKVSVVDLAPHSIRRVNFNYAPAAAQPPSLPSFGPRVTASRMSAAEPLRVPFDLHVTAVDHPDGTRLQLLANASLFHQSTADRLVRGYAELLAAWANGAS